ncbi:tryptophan synthase subunit beta [Kosmotoga arenicorallina S304]|uniref:Tryptophan synthase beta chain n=1 Tax=Kosmotoga arenicorallina S304 TaxID=1453497 RepID=A0A176K139_9BACT|nr:TrpB-like pyridoxal phosphate-dependent enzyme [Kosmotoga arenicorallina]OAA30395.1 tryptophan synthase subunit beta [Kosmotoga arenicorallina S304]
MKERIIVTMPKKEMIKEWYNVKADLPFALDPPLNPQTKEVITPEALSAIFCPSIIEQEVTTERYVKIPEDVLDEYVVFRPTPLIRASFLEEYLETPARIYYKYEGVSPTGSHKTNTALAQAYFNARDGIKQLVTETGAGQWGSALSYAGTKFGLKVKVFMVRISYNQKPMRKYMMQLFDGSVQESPSQSTKCGQEYLKEDPKHPGSLGIAISEAIETVLNEGNSRYSLGSVLDHVLLHQTVIGQELKKQLSMIGEIPTILIGCHGGGSNFGGTILPFIPEKLDGQEIRFIACEPESCPTLTKGEYRYDFGDSSGFTPLLMMYTLGKDFVPPKIHAGGLRYHGSAPIIAKLLKEGLIEADSFSQEETFKAAKVFSKVEGIIPAPESAHAIAGAIREAIKAKSEGRREVIVFNLSGHGLLDLSAYA